MTKREILRAVTAERRATLRLLEGLDEARFDTPTALPRWRIRQVAAHLITTDRASVTGRILPMALSSTDRLEAWNEGQVPSWANRPVPDLLHGLDRWGRRFARLGLYGPRPAVRPPPTHPAGPAPAGFTLWVRAYDEWIHRQDIRRALGMADEDADVVPIAEFLLSAIATHTVPLLADTGGRVEVSLSDVPLPDWAYDLGTGASGPIGATASRPPFDARIV